MNENNIATGRIRICILSGYTHRCLISATKRFQTTVVQRPVAPSVVIGIPLLFTYISIVCIEVDCGCEMLEADISDCG